MVVIKRVERINPIGPDIAAVVNAPELPIPTRAYIFNEDLEPVFRCIKSASETIINRLKTIEKQREDRRAELYQIAFLFGKKLDGNPPKQEIDIFVFPYCKSNNPKLVRADPYLIKNNVRTCWHPRFKGDFALLLGQEERVRRNLITLEEYLNNFPALEFHKYLNQQE
jgi:hypothetical protein